MPALPLRARVARAARAAILAILIAPSPVRANLLANGSFETGPDPGIQASLAAGTSAVAGWTATRGGIRYVGTAWTAAEGARSIALNGANAGGIAQTFPTQRHAQYTMRVYVAGDPETLPNVKTLAVIAAGQRADFTADITGMWAWDPGWDLRVFTFTADADSTTLELFSTMSGTTGPTVDSVSVVVTSLADVAPLAPAGLSLAPPSPHPARGPSSLAFTLDVAADARLSVFDTAGREVAVLADGPFGAGRHVATWNARVGGRAAPPGLYLVSLRTHGTTLTRHLVVVR